MQDDVDRADSDFFAWVNSDRRGSRIARSGAIIKKGKRATKTVEYNEFAASLPEGQPKRVLRFRTHGHSSGASPDFEKDEHDPKTTWYCEGEEIDTLLAYLHGNIARTGRYRVVDADSLAASLADILRDSTVDVTPLIESLLDSRGATRLVSLITQSPEGMSATELAVLTRRRELVKQFRTLIGAATVSEPEVQELIGDAFWLFGGRYVGVAPRNLIPMDQHDIPLLDVNGTLHLIELKRPDASPLTRVHRNHSIVNHQVHEAACQAMNYVRQLDELGASVATAYRNDYGRDYDLRRVFATVVIGNSERGNEPGSQAQRHILQTLRSYNSHLNRVEVVTYDQLVDAAERSLQFLSDGR